MLVKPNTLACKLSSLKEGNIIDINNFINNLDPRTVNMFKNKLNTILTNDQKQALIKQVQGMNKQDLMNKLKSLNISESEFINIMNSLDRSTVSKKMDDFNRRR